MQKKAEAIVQYREKHGNFTSAEQLLEVQGIGKATLERNRDRIHFLILKTAYGCPVLQGFFYCAL